MEMLRLELEYWPGWKLYDLTAGQGWGSHGPDGEHRPGQFYHTTHASWCATVKEDGFYQNGDHWNNRIFEWAASIPEAIEKLSHSLVSRRTDPHMWDHIYEHVFSRSCEDCVRDHEGQDCGCTNMSCEMCIA